MNYTAFTTISFSKCVDRLAANFVPTDYYASLNNTQKMSILRLVINQAVKNFTKKIVNDHLNKIIDNHKEPDNVRLLQDELIDCFLLEREGVYQRFVATQTKTNSNETVNRLVAEKMQKEIKKLIIEKIQLKKENAALKKIIVKNSMEITHHVENLGTLEATVNELNGTISQLRRRTPQTSFSGSREINRRSSVPDNFSEVTPNNLRQVLSHSEPSPSKSMTSEQSEQSAFIQLDEEPSYSPKLESPQAPSPAPVPKVKPAPKEEIAVPKKKRPSSNLGDGVMLDDFY